jgi:hypothetical protein
MKRRRRTRQQRLPTGEAVRFEVHEHIYVSGPHARWSPARRLVHSHEGGDQPHQHANLGPATYTIDKDDWFRLTGFRGGGKRNFTKSPSGEQLAIVGADWQKSFELHICKPPDHYIGEGPGLMPAARMVLGAKMTISIIKDHK